jgi:hypothetical protein
MASIHDDLEEFDLEEQRYFLVGQGSPGSQGEWCNAKVFLKSNMVS